MSVPPKHRPFHIKNYKFDFSTPEEKARIEKSNQENANEATNYRCNKLVGKEPPEPKTYNIDTRTNSGVSQFNHQMTIYENKMANYERRWDKCFNQYSKYYAEHPKAVTNILREKEKVMDRALRHQK